MIYEKWFPVNGFEDKYHVSNLGNVKSLSRSIEIPVEGRDSYIRNIEEKNLKQTPAGNGTTNVSLWGYGKSKYFKVEYLVANAMLKKEDGKEFIIHIDGIKSNHKLDNLAWVNKEEYDIHIKYHKNKRGPYKKHKITNESNYFSISNEDSFCIIKLRIKELLKEKDLLEKEIGSLKSLYESENERIKRLSIESIICNKEYKLRQCLDIIFTNEEILNGNLTFKLSSKL